MHPFNHKREVHAGRKKAHEFSKHFKRGGAAKHDDEKQDASMIKKAMGKHDKQLHGGKHTDLKNLGEKHHGRYARGGKAKSGKGHTHINILVAPKGGDASGAAPGAPPISPGAGAGPMPPKPPMPMPPPGGPPGMAGPPGMIPPPMGRKRGGRTSMTAGAMTGEGRLQKARKYGAAGRHKGK